MTNQRASYPFLGAILHDELTRDDFLELDSLPLVLAELNPAMKVSDARTKGRDPEDLFFHDVDLHGRFITQFSELRGLAGEKLLGAIDRRLRFAEAFNEEFPFGTRYREAASFIRFGLHHEGWFGHLFRGDFQRTRKDGSWKLIHTQSGATFPMNEYLAHLVSFAGPWLEHTPEPRHSLQWVRQLQFAPKEGTEAFLNAVGKSLAGRCTPDDLGHVADPQLLPQVLPRYWSLAQRLSQAVQS
jgi:hypothetical protein